MPTDTKEHPDKRDEIIRLRVESELKERVIRAARKKKKKPAELIRDYLWQLVDEIEQKGTK